MGQPPASPFRIESIREEEEKERTIQCQSTLETIFQN